MTKNKKNFRPTDSNIFRHVSGNTGIFFFFFFFLLGLIIPIQELDEIVNDHFGSGDAQTQSTNDEADLKEQTRTDVDVDEGERDDPPDWEKMKVGLYF